MTAWTRNADIRQRLEKKWNRGEFLGQSVGGHPFEPLRIPLKKPSAAELAHQFEAARNWVAHITAAAEAKSGFTVEWQQVNHRTLGRNKLPRAVVFSSLDDIFAYLGKTRDAIRFRHWFDSITGQFPGLAGLLMKKPMAVLDHDPVWPQLLAVLAWMRAHPCPGIYIRQLEIPGVDTKFIETHRAWITQLLCEVLPESAVDDKAKGRSAFEQRFGFTVKPARVRFRFLDPALTIGTLSDLEITAHDFERLTVRPRTIFVVENEITGLCFPPFPGAMVVIGLGYGLSALSKARWIDGLPLWYWGDLDTHGFAMLDQIRHYFPRTRSFLMDEATLLAHKPLWGQEPSPVSRDLPHLTPDEAGVYDALRCNRYGHSLRLEQERISFTCIRQVVAQIQKDPDILA